jgi:cytochrome c-type biogenesis protein
MSHSLANIADSANRMPVPRAAWPHWVLVAMAASMAALFALFAAGLVLIPRYRAAHPVSALQRSDADRVELDDLYLDLTLATPGFLKTRNLGRYFEGRGPDTVLPVLVGVNTHTGSIAHMHHLHGNFILVGPNGERYPALTSPIVLSDHHNAYMILFPSRDDHGNRLLDERSGRLTVEASDVGTTKLRTFAWDLPIAADTDVLPGHGVASTLMLVVALLGALLVILSPCALELTVYYSAIISCTVTESERAAARAGEARAVDAGRRRLFVNLASFVAGFTLLYAASGATLGLIGAGVRRPLGEYAGTIQVIGGSFILFFAMRLLGLSQTLWSWVVALSNRAPGVGGGSAAWRRPFAPIRLALARLRLRGQARSTAPGGMRAFDSFLVGIGLSTACLTCMGGAVLYPLLVYAGITSWYSGLITLTLYSLGIAVPMVFISLGFFQIRMSLARRLGFNRVLRTAGGVIMTIIGLLIISGRERVVTDLTFRFLGGVARWLG